MIERQTFQKALTRMLDPSRSPWLFLVFSVLISLPGAFLADVLKEFNVPPAIVLTGSILVILALAWAIWKVTVLRSSRVRASIGASEPISPRRGLIVMVSRRPVDSNPAAVAINHHLPVLQHLWLLCTEESDEVAHQMKVIYGPKLRSIEVLVIRDATDPREVFDQAEHAYRRAAQRGLAREDVVADVTGGNVPMSLGLAFAGIRGAHDIEYLKPLGLDPGGPSDPQLLNVRFIGRDDSLSA